MAASELQSSLMPWMSAPPEIRRHRFNESCDEADGLDPSLCRSLHTAGIYTIGHLLLWDSSQIARLPGFETDIALEEVAEYLARFSLSLPPADRHHVALEGDSWLRLEFAIESDTFLEPAETTVPRSLLMAVSPYWLTTNRQQRRIVRRLMTNFEVLNLEQLVAYTAERLAGLRWTAKQVLARPSGPVDVAPNVPAIVTTQITAMLEPHGLALASGSPAS